MVQRGKKSFSEMREKLHRMRMEIQDLEETIEECGNSSRDYSDDYEDRNYRSSYHDREREHEYRGRY